MAAAAGVSAGTASKALNGRGKISAGTRDRVLRAARELAFVPNTLAQGLLAGRSFSVALVTPGTFGRLCLQVMLGAQDTLGASQIPVLIGEARGDPGRERRYLETFAARLVDGLIVAGRRPESAQGLGASPGIPVVHALGRAANGGFSVLPDVAGGARLAAEHLLGLGRRRIAHITGPECHASARLEASGFTAALRAAGVERCGPVMHGQRDESWGREAAGRLLPGRPDAIFCGSDQIARGSAETVRALGFRIPEDIALVGSGNWASAALGAHPELTSVDLCLEEVGRVAAVYLLSAIAGEAPQGVHRVPARLAVRRSSGGGEAGRAPAGPSRTGLPVREAAGPGRTGMSARQAAGQSDAPAMAGLGQRGGNDMNGAAFQNFLLLSGTSGLTFRAGLIPRLVSSGRRVPSRWRGEDNGPCRWCRRRRRRRRRPGPLITCEWRVGAARSPLTGIGPVPHNVWATPRPCRSRETVQFPAIFR